MNWYIREMSLCIIRSCIIRCISSGIFETGTFEIPEVYIMIEHVVDRSLDERDVVAVRRVRLSVLVRFAKPNLCCGVVIDIDETPVATVILPQIGELPVYLSLR